jgi:hypothetical protein
MESLILQFQKTTLKTSEERLKEWTHKDIKHIKSRRNRKRLKKQIKRNIRSIKIQIQKEIEKEKQDLEKNNINILISSLRDIGF